MIMSFLSSCRLLVFVIFFFFFMKEDNAVYQCDDEFHLFFLGSVICHQLKHVRKLKLFC